MKSMLVKLLYIISFYGGGFIYFRKVKPDGKFISYYVLPLLLVVIMVIVRHAGFSFSKDVSGFVTKPFYNDHTIYSAALAFLLPLSLMRSTQPGNFAKYFFGVSSILIAAAIFFAASRAAWLSIAVALIFGLLIYFRFPPWGYIILVIVSVFMVSVNYEDVVWQLKSNRSDSNARNAGIEEQTRSLTNITNDQSNAERINRWKCAVRMFLEKPITGFGPGTYQFVYFPFQRESDMTRISVKSPYNIAEGRGGTAHNEFLLVLSESGFPAALFFLLIILFTIRTAILLCYPIVIYPLDPALLLGFITFIIHSLFNNFLDTDKTAILFFIAIAYFTSRRLTQKSVAYE